MELTERIAGLSDFQAVVACQDLAAAFAARSEVPLIDAVDQLPAEVTDRIDAQTLKDNLDENYHLTLAPDVSIKLARSMLAAAADDPELAPILVKVLDETQDTKQFALEVLALGAAISMIIATATTTKGKDGWGKKALSAPLAAGLADLLKTGMPLGLGGPSRAGT